MSNALMFPGGRPRMVRRSFLWLRMNGDEAAAFINKKTALAITPVVGRRSAGATTRKVGGMPAGDVQVTRGAFYTPVVVGGNETQLGGDLGPPGFVRHWSMLEASLFRDFFLCHSYSTRGYYAGRSIAGTVQSRRGLEAAARSMDGENATFWLVHTYMHRTTSST